jgi:2-oxoisovalerate dehydrogenase E1 component
MISEPQPAISQRFDRGTLDDRQLLELYEQILLPRMIEEKMLILLRQNKISKWFSGIGQEAVAVGTTLALRREDYILPLHRNLGVFTARNVDLVRLVAQWQGKKDGFTKGRDRSFHFGAPEYRIIGMISHLGAMLPVADGLALASKLDHEDYLALVYSGDGGASEGDFHEAINVAAVWDLPVLFLIENNGYGLSTPSSEQFRCRSFVDKAIGYGIEGISFDGNDILAVYQNTQRAAEYVRRNRKPLILEAMTFRMRGHEEASGIKYVPKELLEHWAAKDPVVNYERWLLSHGLLTDGRIQEVRQHYRQLIEQTIERAFNLPEPKPDTSEELRDVYAPTVNLTWEPAALSPRRPMRFVDALSEGLNQAMQINPRLIIMGQDIAEYGGVFKVTQGFVERYGNERVRNTPLCESAILGAGLGLGLRGWRSVIEMQFADFVSCGFNQIVNNLAKTHYRWASPVPVVVRLPTGGGVAAGPFHSQSNEAWFFHVPGLKIVYPATAYDAKGLIRAAIDDPNPVLFFEHKKLYRSIQDEVPEEAYSLPIGKARLHRRGHDLTIVTYGLGVYWAEDAANQRPGCSIEIVDLRTLLPWDQELVFESVRKTGKCLVLHEATQTGGIGAEIASVIGEVLFKDLDAPVMRLGSLDTPVPFHADLEENFFASSRLLAKLDELIAW